MANVMTARRPVAYLAGVIASAVLVPAASAHHSHPIFYDMCTTVSIEGRVTRVQWKTPHSLVDVETDAGAIYHVEWMAEGALSRQASGAEDALTIGARVAVSGHPHRSGAAIRVSFPDLPGAPVPNTVDPIRIRRVDGSFSWMAQLPLTPPDCGVK